jgi:hypothetical protein
MSTSPNPLRLSVVFVVRHTLSSIQRTLECLLAQTAAPRIELILSADSPELLREAKDFLAPRARFAQSRFLLHRTLNLAQARVASAAQATGDIVAFSEDHCFPEPNWAEELLAAFDSSEEILAAAPTMFSPNPETALSRVQFLLFFGRHRKDSSSRRRFEKADSLPWHNTAYRRTALAGAIHDKDSLLIEGFLQREIRTRSPHAWFVRCTRTSLGHVNMSRLCPAIKHAFLGGRIFGSVRARQLGWGPAARALRFVLFPLVPLMVIQRSVPLLRDKTSLVETVANVWTAGALQFVHAFGESVGTCFGLGRAADAYADLECDRRRFVRPTERPILLSMQDTFGSPRKEHS